MNAGLPGTGIGGLFYLVAALLMPIFELIRVLRGQGDSARWRLVGRQFALASAILVSLWATGWLLSHLIVWAGNSHSWLTHPVVGGAPSANARHTLVAVRTLPTALALLTLVVVLGGVEILRLVVVFTERRRSPLPGGRGRGERS